MVNATTHADESIEFFANANYIAGVLLDHLCLLGLEGPLQVSNVLICPPFLPFTHCPNRPRHLVYRGILGTQSVQNMDAVVVAVP